MKKLLTSRAAANPLSAIIIASGLAGCAAMPDVTLQYMPTTWSATVSVVRVLRCLGTGPELKPVDQWAWTVTPSFSADPDRSQAVTIRLKDLDRFYSDSELAIAFTDDGRLKSINTSSTGQGRDIVSGAIGLVAAVRAADTLKATLLNGGKEAPSVCALLKTIDPELKPVTLVYRASVTPGTGPCTHTVAAGGNPASNEVDIAPSSASCPVIAKPIEPTDESQVLLQLLSTARDLPAIPFELRPSASLRGLGWDRVSHRRPAAAVSGNPTPNAEVMLRVQRMGLLTVTLGSAPGQKWPDRPSTVKVPLPPALAQSLPIPAGALFGKETFQLELADSGEVIKIGYGKGSGAAAALGTATAFVGAETAKNLAEVAALNAELTLADLLKKQRCLGQPDPCQ